MVKACACLCHQFYIDGFESVRWIC